MKVVWVLLLVTAYGVDSDSFDTKSLGGYATIAECHVAATTIFWEHMPMNQEALCIRVEHQSNVD
ncbi:MAG: hypothetical protein CMK96_10010 [Pseudomonas sp.]|jgi:hypothetical protein|nr:hypothetical protein [Pseudomonas sp.]|tara:strand:+ start:476 stop:670 length:195 start_codon:yes stop_codon:yes gene_type:complete